jgi:hypothetical protein
MTTTTDLTKLEKDAQAAASKLAKAQEVLEAERQAETERRKGKILVAEQAILDAYDRRALRQAKADARDALTATVADPQGNVGAAIVDYLAAIRRELLAAQRAASAVARGATPRPDQLSHKGEIHVPDHFTDGEGREVNVDTFAVDALNRAVQLASQARMDAEQEAQEAAYREQVGGTPLLSPEERARRRVEAQTARRQDRIRREIEANGPGSIRPEDMTPEQYEEWRKGASSRPRRSEVGYVL